MLPPLFIIGTERSGSNLLRLQLDAHPRIAVPHPPHLVRYFKPLQRRYGDLESEPAFRRLVSDVRALLETHVYPWEVPIDWDRLVREARPRDVFGVQYALYGQYAEAHGKPRWACKSTFHVDEVDTLLAHHPQARFVWLVRDPRDVAVSSRASVFSATHPVFVAELWARQQARGAEAERRWPEAVVRVRYEDLVTRPRDELARILSALGEPWDDAILRHHETSEARRSGSLAASWRATAEPVRADNTGKWRGVLSPREVAWIEGICGDGMRLLGYAPSTAAEPPRFSAIERARFHAAQALTDAQIELRSLREDRNVWRRWRREILLRRLRWSS